MTLTPAQGTFLLQIARSTIDSFLSGVKPSKPKSYDKEFDKKYGVFVTLNKNEELRGCIGYPEPIKPLIEAVMDSAINAATQDPRFPPVTPDELPELKIEITILTPPKLIKVRNPVQYRHEIQLGVDGLIVERGMNRGLLLPQVAAEWRWGEEQFLEHTCLKTGLPADAWEDKETKVYKFQGQIFKES
ncbi:MAG: TIGR00296 family protein [archaeon]